MIGRRLLAFFLPDSDDIEAAITFSMPILLDKPRTKRIAPSWVSWQSAA